jgi:Spy/CpxP family protein refolding chaperone
MIARTALGKILVFAVFFIGIATGAVLDNMYRTRVGAAEPTVNRRGPGGTNSQDRMRRDRDAMDKYLGLDQAQQEQVHKILEETRSELRALRAQVDPKFRAIEENSRERIHAILTEEQRRKLDEYRESHRGDRGGDRGRPPRGPDKQDKKDKDNQQ